MSYDIQYQVNCPLKFSLSFTIHFICQKAGLSHILCCYSVRRKVILKIADQSQAVASFLLANPKEDNCSSFVAYLPFDVAIAKRMREKWSLVLYHYVFYTCIYLFYVESGQLYYSILVFIFIPLVYESLETVSFVAKRW